MITKRVKKERTAEFYKKRLERLMKMQREEKKMWMSAMRNLRELQEEELVKMEGEIDRLNQFIGIMKTGRIRYESTIQGPVSENFNGFLDSGKVEKVSGVIFLQEIQQVEVRPDHVLIVTNSGREIALGRAYDYLEKIFLVK
jgi:hypothetical protein